MGWVGEGRAGSKWGGSRWPSIHRRHQRQYKGRWAGRARGPRPGSVRRGTVRSRASEAIAKTRDRPPLSPQAALAARILPKTFANFCLPVRTRPRSPSRSMTRKPKQKRRPARALSNDVKCARDPSESDSREYSRCKPPVNAVDRLHHDGSFYPSGGVYYFRMHKILVPVTFL